MAVLEAWARAHCPGANRIGTLLPWSALIGALRRDTRRRQRQSLLAVPRAAVVAGRLIDPDCRAPWFRRH